MIPVRRRATSHEDRAGDPLDGLVNMFDIGIVLSLGFLLAALSSLQLSKQFTEQSVQRPKDQITVPKDAQVKQVPSSDRKVVGQGTQVGQVYRLKDGRLVYVVPKKGGAAASPSAPATP
ncbi:hypothetical protein GCM10011519_03440 [Marmoricola endophyticus]|uniref:DUF2149 domain-containing protein n=1 Tax=Marmoricola endophyticus TaxID=2040280 RepID=A0A917BAE4_9ACTN|nr:DUF2149 domain-containing protein [Marmoricola endophyticus]GGF33289.1 hypothetical protein GCM10011519_03440 [Marmoricola endophyticus]